MTSRPNPPVAPAELAGTPAIPQQSATWLYRLLQLGVVLAAIGLTIIYAQFTVDDSFITFRYGKNLIEHGLWNWNADRARVEGYTSSLYALLSIIPALLRVNPLYFFKLVSLMIFITLWLLLKRHAEDRYIALAGLLLLTTPYMVINFYSGLEHPCYVFFIAGMMLLVRNERPSPGQEKLILTLALLLPLTRPEGIVFSLCGLYCHVVLNKNRLRSWRYAALLAGLGAAYFAWRWSYFGHLFPNTFYIKSIQGSSALNVIENLAGARIYLVLMALMFVVGADRRLRAFMLAGAGVFLFVYAPSSLHTNYADRFVFQALIPVLLGATFLLKKQLAPHALAIALLVTTTSLDKTQLKTLATSYPSMVGAHKALGLELARYEGLGYSMLLGDAGIVPYYAGWKSYDFIGLADVQVAHAGLSQAYLEASNPDLILLYSQAPNPTGLSSAWNQRVIFDYIQTSGQYEFVAASRWQSYYLISYLKHDLPHAAALRETLRENERRSTAQTISLGDLLRLKFLV